MWLIVLQYQSQPAEIQKDTRVRDWLILIILLILITVIGLKLVTMVVVLSNSMQPQFERGDIIFAQSIFVLPIQSNDIITFNVVNERTAITHRVITVNGDRIITKGGNNPWKDDYSTTTKDVIYKAFNISGKPIVVKGLGALFITDYSKTGVIYKWGDRFTFMQQLSQTIKSWGYVVTIIAVLLHIISIRRQ